jgi:hypothetical protein
MGIYNLNIAYFYLNFNFTVFFFFERQINIFYEIKK